MRISPSFTLPEVLLALFVLAVSMTILSNLQIRAITRVGNNRENTEYIFIAKKKITELFLKPPKNTKPLKETLETPPLKIESKKIPLHKKSSLYPLFKDRIALLQTVVEWNHGSSKKNSELVTFILEKEKKEGTPDHE